MQRVDDFRPPAPRTAYAGAGAPSEYIDLGPPVIRMKSLVRIIAPVKSVADTSLSNCRRR